MSEARSYLSRYSPENTNTKTYVTVKACFNPEGEISPEAVIWEDGRSFDIDRVTEVRMAASLKGGGCGIRYTCMIKGKETFIFLDGSKWFVEKK